MLEELGPLVGPITKADGQEVRSPAELQLNELETAVLAALGDEPATIDAVVAASRLSVPQVLATLSVLEMRRLVQAVGRQPGRTEISITGARALRRVGTAWQPGPLKTVSPAVIGPRAGMVR